MKPIFAPSDDSSSAALTASKVPLGISLVFYGLELTALAIILTFTLPLVSMGNMVLLLQIIKFVLLAVIIGKAMGLVGKLFCLTAPSEMKGRNAIYLAAFLEVGSLGLDVVDAAGIFSAPWVTSVSGLMVIVAFAFFLQFLKQLGVYMQSKALETQASDLLRLMFMIIISYFIMIALPFIMARLVVVSGLLAIVVLILAVLGLIRYVRLLLNFKRALKG